MGLYSLVSLCKGLVLTKLNKVVILSLGTKTISCREGWFTVFVITCQVIIEKQKHFEAGGMKNTLAYTFLSNTNIQILFVAKYIKKRSCKSMLAPTFNPSTKEAEGGDPVSLR